MPIQLRGCNATLELGHQSSFARLMQNPINSIRMIRVVLFSQECFSASVFPVPSPPTYNSHSFPNELCWIPRNFDELKNDSPISADSVPAIIRMCDTEYGDRLSLLTNRTSLWMVISHGNAYDIGLFYHDMYQFANTFKVSQTLIEPYF